MIGGGNLKKEIIFFLSFALLIGSYSGSVSAQMIDCDLQEHYLSQESAPTIDYRGKSGQGMPLRFDPEAGEVHFFDIKGGIQLVVQGEVKDQNDLLYIFSPAVQVGSLPPQSMQLSYYKHSKIYVLVWRFLNYNEVMQTKWSKKFSDPSLWSLPDPGKDLSIDWGICRS